MLLRIRMTQYRSSLDYHVHERHSEDAANTKIMDIVRAAELRCVTEVAFTTHLITGGHDSWFGIQSGEISGYIEEIYAAQKETNVTLLAGLEVDYLPEEERNIERILGEFPLDFVLGSTHSINGLSVASKEEAVRFFSGRPLSEAIYEYFKVWNQAIDSGLFDIMAHPDYFRKYLPLVYNGPLSFSDFGLIVYDSFDKLVSNDIGFEVNTSCYRHRVGDFFPFADFVKEAHDAGIKAVTVGSDMHIPSTLGFHISEALNLLNESGYNNVCVFRRRRRFNVGLEELRSDLGCQSSEILQVPAD